MPPKNKKSKKNKSKKKKVSPVKLIFKEVVMAKQLEVKEQHIIEMKKYLDEFKLQNEHQKENSRTFAYEVVNQALKISKEEEVMDHITYTKVEEALADKFNSIQINTKSLEEMSRAIVEIENVTKQLENDLEQLKNYQADGKFKDQTRIDDLLHEIEEMEVSYKEIESFFQRSFLTYKHVVAKQNDENLTRHKKLASERVFNDLENENELEFLDNKWLLKEVGIHRQHVANASRELEALERANITLISSLFDQSSYENWMVCQDFREMQKHQNSIELLSSEIVESSFNQVDISPLDASLYVLGKKLALHGLQVGDENDSAEKNLSSTFKLNSKEKDSLY